MEKQVRNVDYSEQYSTTGQNNLLRRRYARSQLSKVRSSKPTTSARVDRKSRKNKKSKDRPKGRKRSKTK